MAVPLRGTIKHLLRTSLAIKDMAKEGLRHTWATRCIEIGMPIAHVQFLGGGVTKDDVHFFVI